MTKYPCKECGLDCGTHWGLKFPDGTYKCGYCLVEQDGYKIDLPPMAGRDIPGTISVEEYKNETSKNGNIQRAEV